MYICEKSVRPWIVRLKYALLLVFLCFCCELKKWNGDRSSFWYYHNGKKIGVLNCSWIKTLSSCQKSTLNNSGDKSSESSPVDLFNNNNSSKDNDLRCAVETDDSPDLDSVDLFQSSAEDCITSRLHWRNRQIKSLRASHSDNSFGHNSTDEDVLVLSDAWY